MRRKNLLGKLLGMGLAGVVGCDYFNSPVDKESHCLGIRNPSAVYCHEMGYEYVPEGICKLPDGSEVAAWEFLRGEVGQEYSYCAEQGYEIKTIGDSKKCSSIYSYNCGVCVLDSGEEVEVTELMGLDFGGGCGF